MDKRMIQLMIPSEITLVVEVIVTEVIKYCYYWVYPNFFWDCDTKCEKSIDSLFRITHHSNENRI